MSERDIKVEKTEGVQPEAESRMIDEGGLGAETYYKGKDQAALPIHDTLNELVSNLGVFYTKLHQYHWYVQGPHFFTLHEKFEQLYNEATEYMDSFAERLIAKRERPVSTLKEFIENATIIEEEYIETMSAEEMVDDLIGDFAEMRDAVKRGIQEASKAGDDVTEDMLIAFNEYIDTTVWMLSAYLR